MLLQISCAYKQPEDVGKKYIDSVALALALSTYISDKLPTEVDAGGLRTTLCMVGRVT